MTEPENNIMNEYRTRVVVVWQIVGQAHTAASSKLNSPAHGLYAYALHYTIHRIHTSVRAKRLYK